MRPIIMVPEKRSIKKKPPPKNDVIVKVEDNRKRSPKQKPLVTTVKMGPKGILKRPHVQVNVNEKKKPQRKIGFAEKTDFTAKKKMEVRKRRRRVPPGTIVEMYAPFQQPGGAFDWKRRAKADQAQREARQAALELARNVDDDDSDIPIRVLKGFRGLGHDLDEIRNLSDLLARDEYDPRKAPKMSPKKRPALPDFSTMGLQVKK